MFGRCVPRCTNFRFYYWTHSSFIIACFCCNLQRCSKTFWCGNHWQCANLWFGQDLGITSLYNDSGRIFSFLPPVKITLTTLLDMSARSVTSNQVNYVIFWGWKHVKERVMLIKQNLAIRKFLKMIFCYFQENRSQSNEFYNWIQSFALRVKSMSTETYVKVLNLISSLVCVWYRMEKRSVRTFDKYTSSNV